MSFKVDIKLEGDYLLLKSLKTFDSKVKRSIGLELKNSIKVSLQSLKSNLTKLVNKQITGKPIELPGNVSKFTIPKSDETYIKQLLKIDLDKVRETKDFKTLISSNVVIAKKFGENSFTTLQTKIKTADTFESQYRKALNFFNRKNLVYSIVDNNGNVRYYINNGFNIKDHVKIFCSTETGDTKRSRERFNLDKRTKGTSDWRLTAEGTRFIQNNFLDITDIIDEVKEGNYDQAQIEVDSKNLVNERLDELKESIDDVKNNENVGADVQVHKEIIELINNLNIKKISSKNSIKYELTSSVSGKVYSNTQTWFEIQKLMMIWKVSNYDKWIKVLENSIEKHLKSI